MLQENWIRDFKQECEGKLDRDLMQEEEWFLEWLGEQHYKTLEVSGS